MKSFKHYKKDLKIINYSVNFQKELLVILKAIILILNF